MFNEEGLHELDKIGDLVRFLQDCTSGEMGVKCSVAGSFQICYLVVGVSVNKNNYKFSGTKSRGNERAHVHMLSETSVGCEMLDSGEVRNKLVMGI